MTIFNGDIRQTWADAFISGIPYAVASGMKVTELGKGTVSLYQPARDTWTGDSELQMIHTGCLSVLADTACGLAVGAAMDTPEPIATLDLRMDYLRPAMANTELVCKAECYRLSRSIGFVRGQVFQIGQDEPVATVNATFMRATANTRRKDMSATPALYRRAYDPAHAHQPRPLRRPRRPADVHDGRAASRVVHGRSRRVR